MAAFKLEVPIGSNYNISMMSEKDKTDQINERMMADQGLRGLGGTKTLVSYTDVVLSAYECVNEVTDDNGCDFHTNLSLFLEGLEEDLTELKRGVEVRHIAVRPKEQADSDEFE